MKSPSTHLKKPRRRRMYKPPLHRALLATALSLLLTHRSQSQTCTVNAGVSHSVCGSIDSLRGNLNGTSSGNPSWSFVSGPVGASPVIARPNDMRTYLSGMSVPGDYVFKLSQACASGGTASQLVTITANSNPISAGPDSMVSCGDYAKIFNLHSNPLPPGWTGKWTVLEAIWGMDLTDQFLFSDRFAANTTLQLAPAYQTCGGKRYHVIWTVTSPDGLCTFSKKDHLNYYPDLNNVAFDTGIYNLECGDTRAAKVMISCPFWNLYTLHAAVSLQTISTPAGFSGSLVPAFGNGGININGFTSAGMYEFTFEISFPDCGARKTYGPFKVQANGTKPPTIVNFVQATSICAASGVPSVNFDYTVSDPAAVSYIYSLTPGVTAVLNGGGNTRRSITFTPANGTWTPGEYVFELRVRSAGDPAGDRTSCFNRLTNYLLVYDAIPPSTITTPNLTICIPLNKTSADVTVPLPDMKTSYLGGNFGWESGWKVNATAGPVVGTLAAASVLASSVKLSGLKAGVYDVEIEPFGHAVEEINCSGSFTKPRFRIIVYHQTGANAGTDGSVLCLQNISLAANRVYNPSQGSWSQVSGPSTVSFVPNVSDPNALVSATGAANPGTYVFRWTISDAGSGCTPVSSDVVFTATGNCRTLPVQLAGFTAIKMGAQSLVKWITASEQQTRDFQVEWSTNNHEWSVIGTQAAAGNSNSPVNYQFVHMNPAAGVNYYRLRQNDLNGQHSYSATAMVRFDNNGKLMALPNPTSDQFFVSGLRPGAVLSLSGIDGKMLWTGKATLETQRVQLESYPAGMYLLTVTDPGNGTKETLKIIKKP